MKINKKHAQIILLIILLIVIGVSSFLSYKNPKKEIPKETTTTAPIYATTAELIKLKEVFPSDFIFPDNSIIEGVGFTDMGGGFSYRTNESAEDLSKKIQSYLLASGYQFSTSSTMADGISQPVLTIEAQNDNYQAFYFMIVRPEGDTNNTVIVSHSSLVQ